MDDVVVFGGGGHARVLRHLVRALGHRVVGYAAPQATPGWDLDWLGTDAQVLARPDAARLTGVLGIGKNDAGDARFALLERLRAGGIRFPSWTAPGAIVQDAVLGDATVVLAGAVVVTGSRLGRACIVNTGASVDHDCVLGDDVHVAPGAVLCGGVRVGAHALVGAGATVVPGATIAAGCVVGAGATVTRPLTEPGVYVGTPARRVR